ncbi:unnamed protein product [Effrenium voratum]|nr:unnamed protein product [Effrenium voratum]
MVGLPARGKSYISKAIVRYLNFLGCPTRLFNAGNLRRQCGKSGVEARSGAPANASESETVGGLKASFFDSHNEEAKRLRDELAMDCLDQVLDFLEAKGRATAVGILDATNTTTERRRMVREKVLQRAGIRLVFLESLCDDKDILQHNYDLKLGNADYKGMSADQALKDFMNRVNQYAEVYEPVQDDECNSRCGYIKLINAGAALLHKFGEKLICHRCRSKDDEYGVLRYIFGLMCSINLGHRCIMLAMVGETEHDRPTLGPRRATQGPRQEVQEGHEKATEGLVAERERVAGKPVLAVMCGTLTRHLQTVEALKAGSDRSVSGRVLKLQRLNELCAGALDSHSYKDRCPVRDPRERRGAAQARAADLCAKAACLNHYAPGSLCSRLSRGPMRKSRVPEALRRGLLGTRALACYFAGLVLGLPLQFCVPADSPKRQRESRPELQELYPEAPDGVMSEEQLAHWRSESESAAGFPPTSDELRQEVARPRKIVNFRRLQLVCDGVVVGPDSSMDESFKGDFFVYVRPYADVDWYARLFGANNHFAEVVHLLEHPLNPDVVVTDTGRTLLHFAAEHGNHEAVRCLLEVGANKDPADRHWCTPLHFAALNGGHKWCKACWKLVPTRTWLTRIGAHLCIMLIRMAIMKLCEAC